MPSVPTDDARGWWGARTWALGALLLLPLGTGCAALRPPRASTPPAPVTPVAAAPRPALAGAATAAEPGAPAQDAAPEAVVPTDAGALAGEGAVSPEAASGAEGEGGEGGWAAAPSTARGEDPRLAARVERMLRRANRLVGLRSLKKVTRQVPDDCTGFVRLVYAELDVALEGASNHMYDAAQSLGALHGGEPRPGDLAFFRETYDRNRDGRRNDGITHVAVVEGVDARGNVVFVHRGSKGIARARMNLQEPHRRRGDDGETLNDYLRPAKGRQRAYYAGELFVGYASADVLMAAPMLAASPSRERAPEKKRARRTAPAASTSTVVAAASPKDAAPPAAEPKAPRKRRKAAKKATPADGTPSVSAPSVVAAGTLEEPPAPAAVDAVAAPVLARPDFTQPGAEAPATSPTGTGR